VRILALDYGAARTGVAVCDPTETVVRPCGVVPRADSLEGLQSVAHLSRELEAELIVVGVPVSLGGGEHAQARAARAFAARDDRSGRDMGIKEPALRDRGGSGRAVRGCIRRPRKRPFPPDCAGTPARVRRTRGWWRA